jgi:hypothetical protein
MAGKFQARIDDTFHNFNSDHINFRMRWLIRNPDEPANKQAIWDRGSMRNGWDV